MPKNKAVTRQPILFNIFLAPALALYENVIFIYSIFTHYACPVNLARLNCGSDLPRNGACLQAIAVMGEFLADGLHRGTLHLEDARVSGFQICFFTGIREGVLEHGIEIFPVGGDRHRSDTPVRLAHAHPVPKLSQAVLQLLGGGH